MERPKKDSSKDGNKKERSNVTITMSDFQQFDYLKKEEEAHKWIEAVIKEDISANLHEALQDGVVLCKIANAMFPGAITRYNKPSSPAFKLIENINLFLAVAQKMGLSDEMRFTSTDLFENKNMTKVIACLHNMSIMATSKGFAIKWPDKGLAKREKSVVIDPSKVTDGMWGPASEAQAREGMLLAAADTSKVQDLSGRDLPQKNRPSQGVKQGETSTAASSSSSVVPSDDDSIEDLLAKMQKLLGGNADDLNPLHVACKENIPKVVDHLVAQKTYPIDASTAQGWTSLHYVAQQGNEVNARKLVTGGGANINVFNKDGSTPLHIAAAAGNEAVVKFLLEQGALVNREDGAGNMPLHVAAQGGHEGTVRLLVDKGATINAINKERSTPLHFASLGGHDNIVKHLLEKGGNVKASNKDGNTALHYATLRGHKKVVDKLIIGGSDVNALNNEKATPLHVATESNHLDVVETLAEKGADVDTRRTDGWTPLYSAAYNGNAGACSFLLHKGADANAQNGEGWTPLHASCANGHRDVVELLVKEHKAKVNLQSKQGTTPLFHACAAGRKSIVELLLNSNADKELSANRGWKPIHIACYNDHDHITRILVAAGVDLNPLNDEIKGYAPLHIVISTEKPPLELIELLLKKGADVNLKNANGSTPLHLAVFWSHMSVVQLLIQYNADLALTNNKGRDALSLSCHYGNEEMARFLAKKMGKDESKLRIKKNQPKLMDMGTPQAPPAPEDK